MHSPLNDLLAAHGLPLVVPTDYPNPSFSVIVRTLGQRPNSLAETLASLAAQTYDNFETLVVVHQQPEILEKVEASLVKKNRPERTRFLNVTGGGEGRPMNVGIDQAVGDYVCCLDDDDLAYSNHLQEFANGIASAPGTIIRTITECQNWTTAGGDEPKRLIGKKEQTFASQFDFLAHLHHNETPNCSVAFPRLALHKLQLRFDETLEVLDDWDFLMRAAMLLGVTSIPTPTALYRRLDNGNAFTRVAPDIWQTTHKLIQNKLSRLPLVVPAGSAVRLADAEFQVSNGPAASHPGASNQAESPHSSHNNAANDNAELDTNDDQGSELLQRIEQLSFIDVNPPNFNKGLAAGVKKVITKLVRWYFHTVGDQLNVLHRHQTQLFKNNNQRVHQLEKRVQPQEKVTQYLEPLPQAEPSLCAAVAQSLTDVAGPIAVLSCGDGELVGALENGKRAVHGVGESAPEIGRGVSEGLDLRVDTVADCLSAYDTASLAALVLTGEVERLEVTELLAMLREAVRGVRSGGKIVVAVAEPSEQIAEELLFGCGFSPSTWAELLHKSGCVVESLQVPNSRVHTIVIAQKP